MPEKKRAAPVWDAGAALCDPSELLWRFSHDGNC